MSDHAFRVYRALKYIDENLFSAIDLHSVAQAGTFSDFHFHRVFSSLMGASVSDYIRRRRLFEASRRLIHSGQTILDLALECQYESQAAFTRSFKKQFGVSPGQLRKSTKLIEADRPLSIDDINSLMKGERVKPEIQNRNEVRVIGLPKVYEFHDFQLATEQWGQFLSRLTELRSRHRTELLGIALEAHPDVISKDGETYIYVTGVEVSVEEPCPEGMVEIALPPGPYARFVHSGHIADFSATSKKVWNHWLPESGLKVSDGPQIEVYGPKFKADSAHSECELLFPIEA